MNNNNIRNLLTISFSIGIFCIMNNPKFITRFSIKLNDEHIIYYGLIYGLLVYTTYMLLLKIYPNDNIENFTPEEIVKSFTKTRMDNIQLEMDKQNSVDGEDDEAQCKELEGKLLSDFMSDDDLKKTIDNMKKDPYLFGVCTEDDKDKCNQLDMTKFVHKDSIPNCDYVLPEQFNLYKKRKGYEPGNPAEDPTLDTIINKNNYIMFYIGFVILLGIYISVQVFHSIF